MKLTRALRLGPLPRLALVGAGGKTTALFQLAGDLLADNGETSAVLVSATTHLAVEQLALAGRHIRINSPADMESLAGIVLEGAVLLTGPEVGDGRTAGLQGESLESLRRLAEARRLPLLLEADGSRRRPLKAPGDHEPALPGWVEQVVVVSGLSALGKPLTGEWVHRPEQFAAITGLQLGAPLTPQAFAAAFGHPLGGLKNIPPAARRTALLNQADTPALEQAGREIAAGLLPAFAAAAVASLNSGEIRAVEERVAGILLAAGASRRYGGPKQLLYYEGEPMVRRAARNALQAGLSPLRVVTGAYAAEIQQALEGLPVEIVHNPDWEAGQSTSVRAGLSAPPLPPETGAAVFLLADQPQAPPSLVRSLVDLHARTLAPLVAPLVEGQRANPVLFDRDTFPELLALRGDMGGRPLFSRYQAAWLPWDDPGLLLDVDTQEDYRRLVGGEAGD